MRDEARRAHPVAGLITIDQVRLYRELAGTGHPLVLLHAGIADCRMWDQQISAFVGPGMVIRFDARGFGRSDPARGQYSPRADLLSLLAAHDIEQAHLLGLSMGGAVALDAAIAHPERVSALIVAATRPSGMVPSPALRDAWHEVDVVLGTGDLERANELEVRMWMDGPNRTPAAVDPSVWQRMAAMNRTLLAAADEGIPSPLDPPAVERLSEVRA